MSFRALSIDFGSSNVKAAWRRQDGGSALLSFEGQASLPAVFFLPEATQDILVGRPAQRAAEDDAVRAVFGLKDVIIRHASVRTTPDRVVDAQTLLDALFDTLRVAAQTQSDGALAGPETEVHLSLPAQGGHTLSEGLLRSARRAGWSRVHLEAEAVAAGYAAWHLDQACTESDRCAVIVDCGAESTTWTQVRRTTDPLRPFAAGASGRVPIGGTHLDRALFDRLAESLPEMAAVRGETRLQDQIRHWKEAAFDGNNAPFLFKGRPSGLDVEMLETQHHKALLNRIVDAIGPFIAETGRQDDDFVVVLLGAAATAPLQRSLQALHGRVALPAHGASAVVRGLLEAASRLAPAQREAPAAAPADDGNHATERSPSLPGRGISRDRRSLGDSYRSKSSPNRN